MLYRVVLLIEHLPDDPTDADDLNRPIIDENVHTARVLEVEHSFTAANTTFTRVAAAHEAH